MMERSLVIVSLCLAENLDRVWKAVELYTNGRAPIYYSRVETDLASGSTEAVMMRNEAIKWAFRQNPFY